MSASPYSGIISFIFGVGVLVVICAIVGAVLVGLGYTRRRQNFRNGALVGAVLGASISLLILGALGIAASNTDAKLDMRLASVGMVGLGLLLLFLLRQFMPQPEKHTQTIGELSLANIFSQSKGLQQPIANLPPVTTTVAEKPSTKVFLSYRRDDSPDVTGRIYDVLVEHYGSNSIFKDVDSIPFGVDFRKHLQTVIEKCDIVLVIIGDRWLSVTDTAGHPRLTDQADFVRIEIESALQRDIRIVPVLVKGSSMPKEDDLPPNIRELAFRNGLSVRYDPDFHHDMERLIRSLDEVVSQNARLV